jgi:hypothetical protein
MTDSEKLDVIMARLERMERLWSDLLLKRPTRAQQAKKAGVHPSTLRRREKRLEMDRLINGRR